MKNFTALVKRTRTVTDYTVVEFSSSALAYAEKDAEQKARNSEEFINEVATTSYKVLSNIEQSLTPS